MRRVLREVRIGLVAGVTGSAMLLLAQQVSQRLSARPPARVQSQSQWIPPLVDPIAAAQSALERGDSALVAAAFDWRSNLSSRLPTGRTFTTVLLPSAFRTTKSGKWEKSPLSLVADAGGAVAARARRRSRSGLGGREPVNR